MGSPYPHGTPWDFTGLNDEPFSPGDDTRHPVSPPAVSVLLADGTPSGQAPCFGQSREPRTAAGPNRATPRSIADWPLRHAPSPGRPGYIPPALAGVLSATSAPARTRAGRIWVSPGRPAPFCRTWLITHTAHAETETETVGKAVAGGIRPPPPRCRGSVSSLHLPACGFPTPGDPDRDCPSRGAARRSLTCEVVLEFDQTQQTELAKYSNAEPAVVSPALALELHAP